MQVFCILIITIFSLWLQIGNGHATEGVNFFDFLTSSSTKDDQRILFSPEDGKKFRRSFEQKYGPRGKLLIESMGQGSAAFVPRADKNKGNGTKHILKIKKSIVSTTTIAAEMTNTPSSNPHMLA